MPTIREQLDEFNLPVGHVWIKDFLGVAATSVWDKATVYYFSTIDPDRYDPDSISIEWDIFKPVVPTIILNLDTREAEWHSCNLNHYNTSDSELFEFHYSNVAAWAYLNVRLESFMASHGGSDV